MVWIIDAIKEEAEGWFYFLCFLAFMFTFLFIGHFFKSIGDAIFKKPSDPS